MRPTISSGVLASAAMLLLGGALVTPSREAAVQEPQAPPVVDQKKIDEAIRKGALFLRSAAVKESMNAGDAPGLGECPELILLTLLHADVPRNDPDVVALLNFILARRLERTEAVTDDGSDECRGRMYTICARPGVRRRPGHGKAFALPHDRLKKVLRSYNRLKE